MCHLRLPQRGPPSAASCKLSPQSLPHTRGRRAKAGPFLPSWRASRAPIKPRRLVNRLACGSFPSWLAGGGQREAHWRRRGWWCGGIPYFPRGRHPEPRHALLQSLTERAGAVGHCLFSSPPAGPLQNLGSSQSSHPAERRALVPSFFPPSAVVRTHRALRPPACLSLPPSPACFWFGMFLTSTACNSPPRPRSGGRAPVFF